MNVSTHAPSSSAAGVVLAVTTAAPHAAASSAASPKVSWAPGSTTQRALAYSRASASRLLIYGVNVTREAIPSCPARSLRASPAGPVPTSTSCHGSLEAAAASSSSRTPFSRESLPT